MMHASAARNRPTLPVPIAQFGNVIGLFVHRANRSLGVRVVRAFERRSVKVGNPAETGR
jgi:hypothetical protein